MALYEEPCKGGHDKEPMTLYEEPMRNRCRAKGPSWLKMAIMERG